MGYTESGEGMSMETQWAAVKKVLGSVHKMNMERTYCGPGWREQLHAEQEVEPENQDRV